MEIIKGKQDKPLKVVIYGPEGVGKSTLASKFPEPLFIDVESGTSQLDVDRVVIKTFPEFMNILSTLDVDTQGYQTLVIDSADWLEKLMIKDMLTGSGKTSIEDFGYGKGYTHLAEKWSKLLDELTRFQEKTGLHLIFTAHAIIQKFEQPDEAGAYDRWTLKMEKKTAPILKEWSDLLLFSTFRVLIIEENGKAKGRGGHERVIYTTHRATWDAKNRFGLPDELSLDFKSIAHIVPVIEKKTEATPAPVPPPKVEEAVPTDLMAAEEESDLLEKIKVLVLKDGIAPNELREEIARAGIYPADVLVSGYDDETKKRIIDGWETIKNNIIKTRKG